MSGSKKKNRSVIGRIWSVVWRVYFGYSFLCFAGAMFRVRRILGHQEFLRIFRYWIYGGDAEDFAAGVGIGLVIGILWFIYRRWQQRKADEEADLEAELETEETEDAEDSGSIQLPPIQPFTESEETQSEERFPSSGYQALHH